MIGHLITRSYTTAKAEAFAAPSGFLTTRYYNDHSNDLCPYEVALIQAYEELGRGDLAEFVRKGKKYQRLYEFLEGGAVSHQQLSAARRAFLDLEEGTETYASQDDWVRGAIERHRGYPGLNEVIRIHNSFS